jgi:hypothetical protein
MQHLDDCYTEDCNCEWIIEDQLTLWEEALIESSRLSG